MSAEARNGDLRELLQKIASMDRVRCHEAWLRAFKADPPKYMSVSFMQRVLAQDLQCKKLGGYPAATRRTLLQVLTDDEARTVLSACDGETLVREWNGRVYRVDVSPGGYVLDGKTYGSLSAVARHITGARWSGPRFFGLSGKRRA